MTTDLGERDKTQVIDFTFNTVGLDAAPIALVGGAVACYIGESDVQTNTGVTLTSPFDSVVGLHHVRIDPSDAAYTAGSDVSVVLTAGTVDGVSVAGKTLGHFSVLNRLTTELFKYGFLKVACPITTVSSQTQYILTNGPGHDLPAGTVAVFTDTSGDQSVAIVQSYTGSSGTLVLTAAPSYTVTNTSTVTLLAVGQVDDSLMRLAASGTTGKVTVLDNGDDTATVTFYDTDDTTVLATRTVDISDTTSAGSRT